MPEKPIITAVKTLATTRLFQIEEVHLRFSNGALRTFERLHNRGRGAVMILPLLDSKTILLIREYACGIDDYYLSFPKGIIEKEEDITVTANRELMEETGFGAKNIQPLTMLTAIPGYTNSKMYIVMARDLYPAKREGDEPEPIEVVPWPLDNMTELLKHHDFHDARSIAALMLLKEYLTHENR